MATMEEVAQLDKKLFTSACLPCAEAGREKEAIWYCVECKSYFCEQCLQDHNKFVVLRKHQIVDNLSEGAYNPGETEQTKEDKQVECGSHCGQYIDSYCKDHDEVCCSVCVSAKHRFCKQREEILKVAEGIKESQEFSDIKQSLEKFHEFANQEKTDRNKNLTDLEEEKIQILANIDEVEEYLIERIKAIAEASRENVRVTQAKHVNAVKSDVRELDTVMSGLQESINRLNETDTNDIEALISTKKCQKTLAELEAVVKELSKKWQQTDLHYQFKKLTSPEDMKMLGDVTEESKTNSICRFTCKREVNIRQKKDTEICKIKGICQLADGTFVIIDSNNDNMKKLSENLEVTDIINLDGKPESICVTGPHKVAITLPEKSLVQFVKTDERLSFGYSFSTAPGRCTVINYDSGENKLYVCCTYVEGDDKHQEKFSAITVYDTKGTLVTTFDKGSKGQTILVEPHQIFLGTDIVRVIDKYLRIFILKKTNEGQLEYKQDNQNSYLYLRPERGLLQLSEDKMLCSSASGEMFLTTMEGSNIKNLKMEKLPPAPTAYFNKQKSTLLVAGESCKIREYKMPLKILKLLE